MSTHFFFFKKLLFGFFRVETAKDSVVDSQRVESGVLRDKGSDKEVQVVRGQYFVNYGTTSLLVVYTADENGYHPKIYYNPDDSLVPFINGALLTTLTGNVPVG